MVAPGVFADDAGVASAMGGLEEIKNEAVDLVRKSLAATSYLLLLLLPRFLPLACWVA